MKHANHLNSAVPLLAWMMTCTALLVIVSDSLAQTAPPKTVPVKTVLLRNGEMLEGRIVADSERLFVFPTDGGQINLPRANVQRLCTNPAEAYQFLAGRIAPADTAARIRLVEWCLTHNQFAAAKSELNQLRTISKRIDDVDALERRLLMRLQSQHTESSVVATPTPTPARRSVSRPSHVSAEALAEFTRRIQPLLINGCSAAACHGRATTTEFELARPPRGYHSSQRLTQLNLSATLRQLDMVTPGNSPLLKMARTPHGEARAAYGENAMPAFRTIVEWVESVAGPIAPQEPTQSLAQDGAAKSSMNVGRLNIEEEPELPPLSLLTPQRDKPEVTSEGKDPFDAEVFNGMFGS